MSITKKAVADRVMGLRAAAAPGGSGTRPTHLKSLLLAPGGDDALHQWCARWAAGTLPRCVVAVFLDFVARPQDKGGGAVRPIVLGELLVKVAMGSVTDAHRDQLREVLSTTPPTHQRAGSETALFMQFGVGMPEGVNQFLSHASLIARRHPHKALVGIDIENAFGEIKRESCRAAVHADVPSYEPALAQLWDSAPHRLWIETAPGVWEQRLVEDGLWQGSCEASAVFALGLRRAMLRVIGRLTVLGIECDALFYVDDTLLATDPANIPMIWPILVAELATDGLRLKAPKCSVYVPAATAPDPALAAILPQRFDGLPLLGSAVDGEFETFLGPYGLSLQPTQKRLAVALGLARDLKELAAATLRCPTLQVAWIMLTTVVAHALDFDTRVHPPAALQPHAQQLNHAVADTLGGILGVDIGSLNGHAQESITLSAVMGGLGVHEITLAAPFNFATARLQVWPAVRQRLVVHGWSAEAIALLNTGESRTAELEMQNLGVYLDAQGAPSLTVPQTRLDWLQLPAPRPGACGEALKLLHRGRREALLARLPTPAQRARLRSAGGEVAGLFLQAVPDSAATTLHDDELRRSLQWRLGLRQGEQGSVCQHVAATTGEVCNTILEEDGRHCVCCKCGKGIQLAHGFVADFTARCCVAAGLSTRREVVVPLWATWERPAQTRRRQGGDSDAAPATARCVEAWMDVEARGHGGAVTLLHIDATVRHALAASHLRGAASSAEVDGSCLLAAVRDKQARYPPRGGLRVLTAAVETLGRTGEEFNELLRTLAALACDHSQRRGLPAVDWLRKWQTELSCGVARAVAHALADGYLPAAVTSRVTAERAVRRRAVPPPPAVAAIQRSRPQRSQPRGGQPQTSQPLATLPLGEDSDVAEA